MVIVYQMGAGIYFFGITAIPMDLHTENDCDYTVITVPRQKLIRGEIDFQNPIFIFKLNDKQQLALPMVDELSFLCSGRFLSHRKNYRCDGNNNVEPFFNISYTHEKLVNRLRTTFTRLLND